MGHARKALTLRLTHESQRTQCTPTSARSSTACRSSARVRARRARRDVAAGAPGAARRFAVHVLQPLATAASADANLARPAGVGAARHLRAAARARRGPRRRSSEAAAGRGDE